MMRSPVLVACFSGAYASSLVEPEPVWIRQIPDQEHAGIGNGLITRGILYRDEQDELVIHMDTFITLAWNGSTFYPEDDEFMTEELFEHLRGTMLKDMVANGLGYPKRHLYAYGKYPALQCQIDAILSVTNDLRSGFAVKRLLELFYDFKAYRWNGHAINLGAGLGVGGDDPLALWAALHGTNVIMIDGVEERLARGLDDVKQKSEEFGRTGLIERQLNIIPIVSYLSPFDFDDGYLGNSIRDSVGNSVEVIKIDIDSFDCAIMKVLLRSVEAAVLVLETQPMIPPPLKFSRHYHPDFTDEGLLGCSLGYMVEMLRPEYDLLVATDQDVIFVNSKLRTFIEELPPGLVFPWTRFPLHFPIDEVDCFRRSHVADYARDLRYGNHAPWISSVGELHRDWISAHPTKAHGRIVSNLSTWYPGEWSFTLDF